MNRPVQMAARFIPMSETTSLAGSFKAHALGPVQARRQAGRLELRLQLLCELSSAPGFGLLIAWPWQRPLILKFAALLKLRCRFPRPQCRAELSAAAAAVMHAYAPPCGTTLSWCVRSLVCWLASALLCHALALRAVLLFVCLLTSLRLLLLLWSGVCSGGGGLGSFFFSLSLRFFLPSVASPSKRTSQRKSTHKKETTNTREEWSPSKQASTRKRAAAASSRSRPVPMHRGQACRPSILQRRHRKL